MLLEQAFVIDPDMKVKAAIERVAESIGSTITVTGFERLPWARAAAGTPTRPRTSPPNWRTHELACHAAGWPRRGRRLNVVRNPYQRSTRQMSEVSERPPRFRRMLLKMSGEALMGDSDFGHDPSTLDQLAREVLSVHGQGIEQCMVIGGGNIVRGDQAAARGIERVTGDPWACWPR